MANTGTTITITVAALTQQANTAIQQFFGGLQNRINVVKDLNKELQNGSAAANRILGAAAAVFSVQAIRSFVSETIAARKEQSQLDAALRSTGQASAEYVKELAEQRKALSQVTSADDDLVLSVQRQLVSFNVSREQMKQSTEVVLDLAAALGTDAASAAVMFGRALAGEDVAFRGLRVEIDKTLPKAQQIEQAMAQLQARFGGQARAAFSSAAPDLERFTKSVGDARKEVGALLLTNLITPFVQGLSGGLQKAREFITSFQKKFPELSRDIQETARAAGGFFGAIVPYVIPVLALAAAVAALSAALKLLAPAAILARLSLAALAGADVISLFKGVNTLRDFAAGLRLITAAAAPAAAALAALAGALWITNEARRLGRARLDEAQSAGRADAQIESLTKAVQRQIQKLVEAKAITAEFGAQTRKDLFAAHQAWLSGAMGIDEYRKKLREVIDALPKLDKDGQARTIGNLTPKPSAELKNALIEQGQSRLKLALAEAEQQAAIAQNSVALEERFLKESYARQEIDLETYLQRRRDLIIQSQQQQLAPLDLAIRQNEAAIATLNQDRAVTDPNNLVKQAEIVKQIVDLEAEGVRLKAAREILATKEISDLLDLNGEQRELTAELRKQVDAKRQIALAETQGRIQSVENDPDLTRQQRKAALLPLLQEENRLIKESILLNRERLIDATLTEEARIEAQRELVALYQQQADAQQKLRDLQSDDFGGSMRRGLIQLSDEWSNLGENVANVALNGIQTAVTGVSDAIMGAIDGTRTWGQVFAQVGRSIVASLIQIVVQWIAQMTVIAALKRIFGAQDNSQAAQSAAAWAPAAIAASIASYGSASVVGTTAYAAALLTGTALTAGVSGVSGAYEKGGPTPGQTSIIQVGERGVEFVIPANRVQEWGLPFFESIRTGALRARDLGSLAAPNASAVPDQIASGAGGAANVNVEGHKLSVLMADSRSQQREFWKSAEGRKMFVDLARQNRLDIGIGT